MFPMFKRAAQSVIRAGADQIGVQANSEQVFNRDIGYTVTSSTDTNSAIKRATSFNDGNVTKTFDDSTTTTTSSEAWSGSTRKD